MSSSYKLMCVLAHPDDESLGIGGTLAKYARQGVETYLVTATRGERGRFGISDEKPSPEEVGRIRQDELLAAAHILGIKEVHFLDYLDGDLDQSDPREAVNLIAEHFSRIKPQVVITFGPEGGYGHPDHIAISQFTTAATLQAAYALNKHNPHQVSKLYYMAWSQRQWKAYQAAFRDLKTTVDGKERRAIPWPEWAITTRIDSRDYWEITWQAVSCHKTQLAIFPDLQDQSETDHLAIWGIQEYYRAFSLVNGGRKRETDLFEGVQL
ncbi:MAG: PIG-L family deacetylase [bacterium]|nr:MAG: PIG-L family deacetylase [bacterium]